MDFEKRKCLIIVICIMIFSYFFIFLVYGLGENIYNEYQTGDQLSYLLAGKNLYAEFKFDIIRPFGYPLIIGFPGLLGCGPLGQSLFVFFFQAVCWLGSGLILYKILCKTTSRNLAIFGAVLYSVNLSAVYYCTEGLCETVFTSCLLLIVYWFMRFIYTKKVTFLLYFALFLFISSIIKPITLYFSLVTFIIILFYVLINHRERRFKPILLLVVFFLSTIGLQYYGVHKTYKKWEFSCIGKYTLFRYHGSYADALDRNISINEAQRNRDSLLQLQNNDLNKIDKFLVMDIKKKMFNSTFFMFKAYVLSLYSNTMSGSSPPNIGYTQTSYKNITLFQNIVYTNIMILSALLVFMLFCFFKKYRSSILLFLFFCSIFSGALWLISGISFWQGDRFNIVLYPIIIIVFLSLINVLIKWRTSH